MSNIKINSEPMEYALSIKGDSYALEYKDLNTTFQIFKYGKDYLLFDGENNMLSVLDAYQAKDKTIIWVEDEALVIEEESDDEVYAKDEVIENNIKSPMPGIIKEIKFKENDVVKKGDTIVVLESMKVLNELKSGASGVIKRIYTQIGAQVDSLELLVEIEPDKEEVQNG